MIQDTNKEIGSFIELQFRKGNELYKGSKGIARLNSGRAAIWHAFRVTQCNTIWLPYYQCDTVRDFLLRKGAVVKYYHIDSNFTPIDLEPQKDEAVLLVNYYGVMSNLRLSSLAMEFENVIIDNSQGFYAKPIPGVLSIYSARKFVGVSDGAYVIGENAERYLEEYEQGYSSDTATFLLQRIEYGCEGKTYESRMINEHRIDSEDILRMSKLTQVILDGTDYEVIKKKRRENFSFADHMLSELNRIDATKYYDQSCVPMVYPLVIEDDSLLEKLLKHKHYQGHWWSYLLKEVAENTFEYWISRYVIPITIDQRYDCEDIESICKLIKV